MHTVPLSPRRDQAPHNKPLLQEKGKWTSRIRVERRRGRTSYVVTFSSNGRLVASLRGGFTPLPIAAAVMRGEAISAATDGLAHVRPGSTPATQIKKLHYIRSNTSPKNRQHRRPQTRRRAA